jgi:hypothetical protein
MWARRARETGAPAGQLRVGQRLRRARAALRMHRKTLVAIVLAAGIVLMALHWS